jgi:hypothetical protein
LAVVPESDYVEIVNFLVNKDFADAHREMQGNIAQIVNDVNTMLGKDPANKKRYVLGKVMTYPNAAALYTIASTSSYFPDNNFVGNPKWGGSSVVYWVTQDLNVTQSNIPQFFLDAGSTGCSFQLSLSGKNYALAAIADSANQSPLIGKSNLSSFVNGLSVYDAKIATLAHELVGHPHGCGRPEWYGLVFSDYSGILPNLGYNMQALNPDDPMSVADVIKYDIQGYKFSPFNSWLINNNANHQVDMSQILAAAQTMPIQVSVVDALENAVPGAVVMVYSGVENTGNYIGIAQNLSVLLQSVVTDSNGIAFISNSTAWFAVGVKVTYAGRYAGAVITSIDIEDAYFRGGLSVYVLKLVLK